MRVRLDIAYDGRNFFGYQRQKHERTVQGELESLLAVLYKSEIHVHASGRTDTGVHALQQVCAFDAALHIPLERLLYALNHLAPSDLKILQVQEVPRDFHPRFGAISKTYRYRLMLEDDLFQRPYKLYLKDSLDLQSIDRAIDFLLGTHDFYSFSNRRKGEKTTIRTLYDLHYDRMDNDLTFTFTGDGFLYKMVRILMQYLLDVGRGKQDAAQTAHILNTHSREFTRRVAPPQALYLCAVAYPEQTP